MKYAVSTLTVILLLAIAACGNGDNASNSEESTAYVPDFSTPEGASEVYARAIEGNNMTLMELVIAPKEREVAAPVFLRNIKLSKDNDIQWKLEFDEDYSKQLNDSQVISRVKFKQIKDGKEELASTSWVVFAQVEDGSWRFAARISDSINARYPNGTGDPVKDAQSAGDSPSDGGASPTDDSSEPSSDDAQPVD